MIVAAAVIVWKNNRVLETKSNDSEFRKVVDVRLSGGEGKTDDDGAVRILSLLSLEIYIASSTYTYVDDNVVV